MVRTLYTVELWRDGLRDSDTRQIIKEPINAWWLNICSDKLDDYKVLENLVKVKISVKMYFGNRLGMSADILNIILELGKRCEDGVELWLEHTSAFTQSDWDLFIEHVVNNPRLKFGTYRIDMENETDITFNLDTERRLLIVKQGNGTLILNGKMGVVQYPCNIYKLKVEGEFKDIVDADRNSIAHEVFDYESLPDLYESLENRLRRLTSQ